MKKIIIILFVFFLAPYTHATSNEILYGEYTHISSDFSLKFSLDNSGISYFQINGKNIPVTSYDYLGWFGSTQLLEIQSINGSIIQEIKLLILVSGDQVKLISGQYVKAKYNDKSDVEFDVVEHRTFEMLLKPLKDLV